MTNRVGRKRGARAITAAFAVLVLTGAAIPTGAVTVDLVGDGTVAPATTLAPCTALATFGTGTSTRLVPVRAPQNPDCYLAQGHSGGGVRVLQKALIFCEGFSVGPAGVDGHFGPDTKAGLMSFQTAKKLLVDGGYGNQTHNAIRFPSTLTGAPLCVKDTPI